MLKEELNVIDEQIQSLIQLKLNVSERLNTLKEAVSQPLGEVRLRHFSKRSCHKILHPYHTDEEMDLLIKQLLNKGKHNLYIIGNNRIGSLLPLREARKEQYQNYEGVFIIDSNGTDNLEEGDYLSVSYRGDSHQHRTYFPRLTHYAEEHHLTLIGPVLEFLWVDIHQAEDFHEHITELQIMVEKGRM